jgi:8-amino-7-oxononanoate synthase
LLRRDPLAHLGPALEDLEARALRRPAHGHISPFGSNDYLGLASRAAAGAATGAGASRLIVGDHALHRALEGELAAWLGVEACLLFTSGYAANVGVISALAGRGDLIVSDALNHASIVDGARLSRARIAISRHGDVAHVERLLKDRHEERAYVVVESYYSMDADSPDLARLRSICDEHRAALVVDEAHALGVLGEGGRGLAPMADVRIGTLGKAFGGQGAFVAGSQLLRDWLWNRARSFVFSTGLAPSSAAAARAALSVIREGDALRARVASLAAQLRAGLAPLASRGLEVRGYGHVVPVVVGSAPRVMSLAEALSAEGFWVPPIRPPTVPENASRLRFGVTAALTERDVAAVVEALDQATLRF